MRVWDLRQPAATLVLPAHGYEVLSADWCKYNECMMATASVDKSIKVGAVGLRLCDMENPLNLSLLN